MTVSAAELLGGYNIARRTCRGAAPVSQRGRSLVSEFMLQQTLVAQKRIAKISKMPSTGHLGEGRRRLTPTRQRRSLE